MTGITADVSNGVEKRFQESCLKIVKRFLDV